MNHYKSLIDARNFLVQHGRDATIIDQILYLMDGTPPSTPELQEAAKDKSAGALMRYLRLWFRHNDIKRTTNGAALVNKASYWIPVDRLTPIGSKCLLIVKADRNACLGDYQQKSPWTHYHPLPSFDPNEM